MVNIGELLKPNGFKVLLCLLVFILLSMIAVLFINPSYDFYFSSSKLEFLIGFVQEIWVLLLFILVFSYFFGALMDYLITDNRIKYIITVFLGLAAILSIYITYKMLTDTVICDPVHVPNETVICDPVHDPSPTESHNLNVLNSIKIDESAVKDAYNQCLQNLNK